MILFTVIKDLILLENLLFVAVLKNLLLEVNCIIGSHNDRENTSSSISDFSRNILGGSSVSGHMVIKSLMHEHTNIIHLIKKK